MKNSITAAAVLLLALLLGSCGPRPAKQMSDEALLDTVERCTIKYFTDFADPATGLARERDNDRNGAIVTIGGSGFGMMAVIAGAERGYYPQQEGIDRIEKMVGSLEKFERFHGAWAHWYDADTGETFSFSQYDDGGDLVETAFMVQGLLTARQWLRGKDEALSERCDQLWKDVEWDWYTRGTDSLYWHWSKNYEWKMNHRISGYDETLITYVLAGSSPTHPISRECYEASYKTSNYYYNGKEYTEEPEGGIYPKGTAYVDVDPVDWTVTYEVQDPDDEGTFTEGSGDTGVVYLAFDLQTEEGLKRVAYTLTILSEGALDAIDDVKAAKTANKTVNLAGQQVNGAYKGIVIKGHKKFLVK
jgi:hypothetical protein